MRKMIKYFLTMIHLDGYAIKLINGFRPIKRYLMRIDRTLIRSYLASDEVKKLHIGCGRNILQDWLNSDYFPHSNNVLHLDATKVFPIPDNCFDYIYSEHMIEHIPYSSGINMLLECHRILKPNGKIRISTPNLQFLIELYSANKTELQKNYIKWATDNCIGYAPYYDDTFVINNFVRDWGHVFIYDEKTLRHAMENAGFGNICRCNLNESLDDSLKNLENENRMPDGFLRFESITLEATKLE